MAKVKVTNLRKVNTAIRKKITKAARDKEVREAVGEAVVTGIQETRFSAPSMRTLEWRKRYDKLNKTDKAYKRSKINITFTGELLNDLKNNVKVSSTTGAILYIIEHSKKLHKKYQGVTKKIGSRSSYSDISKGIQSHGHNYLEFSPKTLKRVLKEFRKAIFGKLN